MVSVRRGSAQQAMLHMLMEYRMPSCKVFPPPDPQGQVRDKRRKLEGENKICAYENRSGKSLVRYYTSFKKTEIAKRVMIYENGEWNDLPDQIICPSKRTCMKKGQQLSLSGVVIIFSWICCTCIG